MHKFRNYHFGHDLYCFMVQYEMSVFDFCVLCQCLNVLICSNKVLGEAVGQKYSNSWAVQLQNFTTEVDLRSLAKILGLNVRKIFEDYYLLIDEKNPEPADKPNEDILSALASNKQVKWAEQQVFEEYSTRSLTFNDPDWGKQWYLRRETNGRITHNIEAAWEKGYTGKGVTILVVDNGLRHTHEEFRDNYDQSVSYDLVDNDNDPRSTIEHGTKCAGVIAATRNNNVCGVGVAYNSRIGGIRLFKENLATDALEAKAFFPGGEVSKKVDIFSNSWGPKDSGYTVRAPKKLAAEALEKGARTGRNSLGSIYVIASGNGGLFGDSCAFDGYVNSIYTIPVASVGQDGEVPLHSERCGAIMTSVYSNNLVTPSALTDRECNFEFGQTSAAAAFASGIISLALQANPNITWRDIQYLIAISSKPDGVNGHQANWMTNKAGFTVSEYFGFGVLDALALVNNANKWNARVPPQRTCIVPHQVRQEIPATISFQVNGSSCSHGIVKSLEHVQLKLNLEYPRRGVIAIDVTSPSKTKSRFVYSRHFDAATGRTNYTDLVTTSVHFWGEPSQGMWNVKVINENPEVIGSGDLFDMTLILYGTSEPSNVSNTKLHDNSSSSSKLQTWIILLVSISAVAVT